MQQTFSAPTASFVEASGFQKLNIGCGPVQPEGWVNIDNSNRAKLASRMAWLDKTLTALRLLPPTEFGKRTQTGNVTRRIPFADESVGAIYSGEMLEHFTFDDGQRFLAECFRVLKPVGILRLRVPDNYRFWKQYVEQFEQMRAMPREAWTDDHSRWVKMFFRDICVKKPGLKSMGHYHKWMYDEVSLVLAIEKQGFVQTERRAFLDSRIDDIRLVEVRDDLIVEAIKPHRQ
jgi:predicted SAM-dependent methyltransferase